MIKLYSLYNGTQADITHTVKSVSCTGDKSQAARKLDVALAYPIWDRSQPRTQVGPGTKIWATLDGKEIFRGVAWDREIDSGEMGFCTDTKEVYIGDGATNTLVGRSMMGTYASRPNAAVAGRLYYVNSGTNLGYIYLDDGVAWQRANVIGLADLTGNLDNVADGTTYGKVKIAELSSGQVNRISDGTNTVTAATALTHINDATKHRLINDAGSASTDL